jgi:hypothetical protein
VRRAPPPESPPRVVSKTLRYGEAQEPLLRRLGQALVLQWDALSDEMQDLLIDQAVAVDDRDEAPVDADNITDFVRNVKTMAPAKVKPEDES